MYNIDQKFDKTTFLCEWSNTSKIDSIEQFDKFLERDFTILIRIQRLKHAFYFASTHMSTHLGHDGLKFLDREETVSIRIIFLKSRFQAFPIMSARTDVDHHRFEFIEIN